MFRRKWFRFSLLLVVGLVPVIFILYGLTGASTRPLSAERAHSMDSLLRLHVIAHSDRSADQVGKLKVRDALIQELSRLNPATDREQFERELRRREQALIKVAEHTLKRSGLDHPIRIDIGPAHFPEKPMGNTVYPAGTYRAVRVIIGDGKGENWWCVLFPPLCFVEKDGVVLPIATDEGESESHASSADSKDDALKTNRDNVGESGTGELAADNVRFELRLWKVVAESAYADRMRQWFEVAFKND